MRRVILVLLVGLASLTAVAQKHGEASPRTLQYEPGAGGAFICTNGNNRYTRALYGSHSDWRLETSDRPVFAAVKKGFYRNIRMEVNGVPLDSTATCKAQYRDGIRWYVLNDSRWNWLVDVVVVALPDEEGAVWCISKTAACTDLDAQKEPLQVRVITSKIAQPKLNRNGDIGADPPGGFEASPDDTARVVNHAIMSDDGSMAFVVVKVNEVVDMPYQKAYSLFWKSVDYYKQLASRIQFHTPDPYINTLGGALVLAADGDWDGQTWLHGCIGWRMPLAGWRAGYLGDVLGWNDRAVSHFDAYAKSQVTGVEPVIPHPSQDSAQNLARAEKRWGTQMYSNGYICRNPERNDQMHHYDMNLNYIDELLWHFQYDADTVYMRKMWPVLKSHLAWEKRNFDPDGDHLYDAYCCIWASDALYYSGGAVTHSSAYNYRGNKLAARIAEIIGEDPQPYRDEAESILQAMNSRLWLQDKGVWAEFQDALGLKRTHDHPAVWSVYTPIDCGACTPEQAYKATQYIDHYIPHIPVAVDGNLQFASAHIPVAVDGNLQFTSAEQGICNPHYLYTISTSDWMPYSWSINNVAAAEVMHTALAYFEAGRPEEGYRLMKANILDQMYYGQSPANFGQISHYDAARGECYRDFGDCIGISSRTLIQGLFGIIPQALDGKCIIRPGFPSDWDSVHVKTPYLEYTFKRKDGRDIYDITQHFPQPLKIILRQNLPHGAYRDIEGTFEAHQVIFSPPKLGGVPERVGWSEQGYGSAADQTPSGSPYSGGETKRSELHGDCPRDSYGLTEPDLSAPFRPIDLAPYFNASVTDIFRNNYLSPRPQTTTLQIPIQGIGEWCHPQKTAEINDSVFRTKISNGIFRIAGVPLLTPAKGRNIIYTSLWDNYPDSIVIPLKGKASRAYLLMAGSTNHMQSRIDNGLVIFSYTDGTSDTLALRNPDNWCPIEQDYYIDGKAFCAPAPRPYRVCFGTGDVSRDLSSVVSLGGEYGRDIPGGAGQMLVMPLNPQKQLRALMLRTLSNDVVIGLMALTLSPPE